MRNFIALSAAALVLAISAAAYAEPAEHQVVAPAYIFGAQSPDQNASVHEGRSAFVVTDDASAPQGAASLDKGPRSR